MFWTRKENRFNKGGFVTNNPITFTPFNVYKKEFDTMFEILKDAEKYDNDCDSETRNYLLTVLTEKIEQFKKK